MLRENKKRSVLITGMAAALVFMLIINQFVWIIDVEGNVNISKTEILNTVNTLGLKKGTFVPLFDKSKAGRDIVNLSDGSILWASINVKGSLACVEIREYTDIKPEENLSSSPCNIVADFDGVILSNDTYSGICCTSRGSAVKTGDILISGISENADGSVNFLKAEGKLTAFHKTSLSRSFNRKSDIQKLDTKQSFYVLDIFSLHIPLSVKAFSSDGEKYEYGKYLCLDNTVLPFGITEKSYITMTGKITGERKLIDIADEFTGLEYDEFKNSMITATDYCISAKNDTVSITATYDCIDFIGKKIDILKEN